MSILNVQSQSFTRQTCIGHVQTDFAVNLAFPSCLPSMEAHLSSLCQRDAHLCKSLVAPAADIFPDTSVGLITYPGRKQPQINSVSNQICMDRGERLWASDLMAGLTRT